MKNILLIGCGHMGSALLTSWINSKQYHITLIDPLKFNFLNKKYKKNKKIETLKTISKIEHTSKIHCIVIAVRPIDLKNVLKELSKIKFKKTTSLVSVVAGKKINIFRKYFPNIYNYFRVMPNMPASIGESMNCIVFNKEANSSKKNDIFKLFSLSGKSIFLKDENEIDMTTAISGSGPGFVFNLIDAMEKAAIKLGFKPQIARILVLETFKGSIDLLSKSKMSAQQLVNTVATKGGTTEAGLKIMKKNKIHKIFIDLTNASYKKAKQQGNTNGKK